MGHFLWDIPSLLFLFTDFCLSKPEKFFNNNFINVVWLILGVLLCFKLQKGQTCFLFLYFFCESISVLYFAEHRSSKTIKNCNFHANEQIIQVEILI